MGHFKPSEEQLERRASVGRWQIVRASFGTANEDLIIRHQLQTANPEEVAYQALNMTGPSNLYHDGSATRLAWGDGFVRLRSSVAPVVMDILLQVVAAPIGTTKLPMGGATIPGINADTLDGLDSTAFSRNAFKTIIVEGAGDIVADSPDDTLTLSAGAGIEFNSTPGSDEIEIEALAPVIDELDDILDVNTGTPADGDVLTWDDVAGEWVAAAPTGGGGGGGGWVMLEEHIASASATLDFTTWYSTTYDDYVIELINVKPGTTGQDFRMQVSTNAGSSWQATNYYYSWIHCSNTGGSGVVSTGGGSLGYVTIFTQIDNTGGSGVSGSVKVFVPGSTTAQKHGLIDVYAPQVSAVYRGEGMWLWNTTTAINGIRFLFASGTVASGTIRVYGIVKTAGGGGGGGASVLDDLTDVDTPAPADGDVLTWDAATSEWIATAPTGGGGGTGFHTLIQAQTLGSDQATVTFTAIPGTYKHLRLITLARSTSATNQVFGRMVFNNDTAANYLSYVQNAGAGWGQASDVTSAGNIGYFNGTTAPSVNAFTPDDLVIYDYAGSKYKTWVGLGLINATTTYITNFGGRWSGTAAITEIDITASSGNLLAGSYFALYGITEDPAGGGGGGGGASELDDLTDVDLTGLDDNDVLVYDLASGLWKPEAPAAGGGGGSGSGVSGWVLLEERIASSSTTLNFTTRNVTGTGATFQSDYDDYIFTFDGVVPATNAVDFYSRMTTDGGATFDSTSKYALLGYGAGTGGAAVWGQNPSSPVTEWRMRTVGEVSSNTSYGITGTWTFSSPLASRYKRFRGDVGWLNTSGTPSIVWNTAHGVYVNTVAANGVQFYFSSGNIASGTIRCYGITKTAVSSGGALVFLEEKVAASSSSLDFTTAISSTYDRYLVTINNLMPATNATNLWLRFSTNGGSTYDTTAIYAYTHSGWSAAGPGINAASAQAQIIVQSSTNTIGTGTAAFGVNAQFYLIDPLSTTFWKRVEGGSNSFRESGGAMVASNFAARYDSTTAVNAFRFLMSSGNITSGTIRVYGIAKTGSVAISTSISDNAGQLDIANTTTETTLYTYTIPASALSSSKGLALNIMGDWLNNTGSDQTIRLKVKYGATTLHDETTATLPTSANRRAWVMNIQLGNTGSASSQFAVVSWLLSNAQAGTAGLGDAAVAMHLNHLGSGTSAENSATALAFTVTITLSAASANLSFRRQYASLKGL